MSTEDIQKLEAALLSFVVRASKEGATAEEVAALPAVARVLLDFQHISRR